jgi:ABC-2 type transport system permease protein
MPETLKRQRHLPWALSLLRPSVLESRRVSRGQAATRIAFALLGLAIAVGMYAVAVWFLRLCYQVEVVGPLLCRRLLDIVLLVLLSVLLLSNIVTALSTLFLAEDLELWMAAPIPPRSFFAARFAKQVFQSSHMVLAFGLPVLLAFGRVAGGNGTYLAILASVPPLIVFPAAAATCLVLLLVSLLPATRARSLVVALFFVAFVVFYVVVRLVEPERLLNPDGFASMVHLLTSLSSPSGTLLPSGWATTVVAATFRDAALSGEWPVSLAALWTGAGAAFVVASALFRRLHATAYSQSAEGRTVARLSRLWARLRGQPLPPGGRLRAPGRLAPAADWMRVWGALAPAGPHREMLVKDAKLLLRDASQWSQLVLLSALVFVYLYNFRHFRQIGEAGLVGELALYLVGMGLAGFVTSAVSVRFAFPLMSLEGRVLWLLRSAPLRPGQLLTSKLVSTLPPLFVMGEALSVLSSLILGVPTAMVLFGAAVAGVISLSVGALSVGLGAVLPDYRADSAAKVAASFGGLICMSVAIVVALVQVALSVYPAFVLHTGRSVRWLPLCGCVVGILVVGLLAAVIPIRLGARTLSRHEL